MAVEAHKCIEKNCKGYIVLDNADFDYRKTKWVDGIDELGHPSCTECGKEYKVVLHHVVVSIEENGEFEKAGAVCITEWEKREKERRIENEHDPYEKINKFIEFRGYTYSVEDVVKGFIEREKGYYVSHTMKDCIRHLNTELEIMVNR